MTSIESLRAGQYTYNVVMIAAMMSENLRGQQQQNFPDPNNRIKALKAKLMQHTV